LHETIKVTYGVGRSNSFTAHDTRNNHQPENPSVMPVVSVSSSSSDAYETESDLDGTFAADREE
jgi:hypothetical protein